MRKVSVRIVPVQHSGINQTVQVGGSPDTMLGITKQPVPPPQCDGADTILDQIVIHFDNTVIEKHTQSSPMLNQIAQRIAQPRPGWHPMQQIVCPLNQFPEDRPGLLLPSLQA